MGGELEAYKIKPVLFLFAFGFLASTKNFIQMKREINIQRDVIKNSALTIVCHIETFQIFKSISPKQRPMFVFTFAAFSLETFFSKQTLFSALKVKFSLFSIDLSPFLLLNMNYKGKSDSIVIKNHL